MLKYGYQLFGLQMLFLLTSEDPGQLAPPEANWSGSTRLAKASLLGDYCFKI